MNRKHLRTGIVLTGLMTLALASAATGQSTTKIWTSDVVADRQRLMKLNGASWADAQAKLKAGNAEAVAVNAETMALIATQIVALFPEGSLTDKSKAKPEIWQKWPEFESAVKNYAMQADKLRDAARTKDLAATEAVAKDFGRQACGTCHQPFRVPPPQQQQTPAPPQQPQPR
jgi:cytochrome c556